jgi:hypothetical protein
MAGGGVEGACRNLEYVSGGEATTLGNSVEGLRWRPPALYVDRQGHSYCDKQSSIIAQLI